MKLLRLGPVGEEVPVVLSEGQYLDARGWRADFTRDALDPEALTALRDAVRRGELPLLEHTDELRVGAPIARPGAILCIGMNYAAHAAESGSQPPNVPVVFLKSSNTLSGPYDDVAIPRGSRRTDWEVELGIVIGRRALYLDRPEDARECIAGFVVCDDVSERDFQLEHSGGQWSKGKIAPGFSPVGPWLVTPDEFDPSDARLRSWVNGEPRQDSTTADMIFDVDHVVWHLSQYTALDPGDLIMTGTPEGVALSGRFPYIESGDVVETEIPGLGRQRHTFR